MGVTLSSILTFTSAIRVVADVLWVPPAATALHKRITARDLTCARVTAGAGAQDKSEASIDRGRGITNIISFFRGRFVGRREGKGPPWIGLVAS